MRAAVLREYGPPEVLQIEDHPEPDMGPRDVLVAVRASSVNPIDWKIRKGLQRGAIRYTLPWVLGLDVSGEVIAVGDQVSRFQVGDAVFASPTWKRPGAYAERIAIDEGACAPKPKTLTHLEAASVPLVALTAWACLAPKLAGQPGQRALITAGSGGVGTVAIQLARRWGAHVVTTCSPQNHQMVRDLGAEQAIDYRAQSFDDVLSELDMILDAIGGEDTERAFRAIGRGGRIASISSGMPRNVERYGPNLGALVTGLGILRLVLRGKLRGVDAASVLRRSDGALLAEIGALYDAGELRPVIDRAFPMTEVAAAHAYMETGRARGKVVLEGL